MQRFAFAMLACAILVCGFATGPALAGTYTLSYQGTALGGTGIFSGTDGALVQGTFVFANISDTPNFSVDNATVAANEFYSGVTWKIQVGALPAISGGAGDGAVRSQYVLPAPGHIEQSTLFID